MTELRIHIPVIETERLILREPRLSDLDAFMAFDASERSHHVGGPSKPWESWSKLLATIGHWHMRGFGSWTIETKADGRIAGRISINDHIDWPEPELGWSMFEGFEGQGIAYEAALAVRDHAQNQMGLGPLISLIAHDNIRSRRLAERLGATVESEGEVRGIPCLIYRHPKEPA